jgi:Na+-transporting NADH:ubiquinone oxidoreductase subunit NqrE
MGSDIADPDIRLPISGPTVLVSTITCPINAYTYNINKDTVINTVDLSILRFHILQMWSSIDPEFKMVGDPGYVA